MKNPPRGMILLNKSAGLTSFQSLGVCKRSFATKKVGHAGTLDKFAEGLLIVFINEATRLVPFFVGLDKTYEAEIQFGSETDTLDPAGTVIRTAPVPELTHIEAVLPRFLGTIAQIPPAYSAIHIDGKRAYERVLAGEELVLKPRTVEISTLEILDWTAPILRIRVSCSSGTYIRSLARDIATAAQSAAYLLSLKRTRIGPFHLDQAVIAPRAPEDAEWCSTAFFTDRELARKMQNLHILDIPTQYKQAFQSGKLLSQSWFPQLDLSMLTDDNEHFYTVCCDDLFLGVISAKKTGLSYRIVFPPDTSN